MAPDLSVPLLFREQRGIQMLIEHEQISFEELLVDRHSTRMALADRVVDDLVLAARATERPILMRAAEVLERWDRQSNSDSRGAALFVQWAREALPQGPFTPGAFATAWDPANPYTTPSGLGDPASAVLALESAATALDTQYGSLDVSWGFANRLRRNGLDRTGNGAPGDPLGVFSVMIFAPAEYGRRQSVFGSTYLAAVEFTLEGSRAMAHMAYGNATQPGSVHNGDQTELLAQQEMRPVWRVRSEIEMHLEATTLIP